MKRFIIIAILALAVIQGRGQQLPLYSQYMMNGFLLNPAVAGSDGYTTFNITSTITNNGPGAATYVVSMVNNTSAFIDKINNETNHTGAITNYIDSIEADGSETVDWIILAGVASGTYEFCINATSLENTTEVVTCNDITIEAVGGSVVFTEPIANSTETGIFHRVI